MLAGFRVLGVDGGKHTASALALLPYAALAGFVLGGLALLLRRWWTGAVVLALAAGLLVSLLPRLTPAAQPVAAGPTLRVLAVNLYYGHADAERLVELVRAHEVDVLNLLELTPEAVPRLAEAGLFTPLPYRVLRPGRSGAGSGLVSRHPLRRLGLARPALLAQPSARVSLPGGRGVEVVAVHPVPPTYSYPDWRDALAGLPATDPRGTARILAGDFNATLDHAAFRRVLGEGYRDAGEETGSGLTPTWPEGLFPPPVTIDHVLVDQRLAVRDYRVFDVPGTDHDAVYARLQLPA
ncbi:endonuclease/exonuclease/phosphatase (EEP) superfamily protein YafD [Amycolatopsis cihanbeyliensis]|uniref:Endonuclease/exonuclease/phosphatase (EEP) superfamily protein YafD n=2 Tax=Amycolatopsis cihanbeyliensis TaxID=1128664 RepID=A0A542DN43_AMYCI|nr:endonuclease/exonuclease/phosphatase (EEP) superfamily protein YafD [Amycolatopsis cihanbeyliensis]